MEQPPTPQQGNPPEETGSEASQSPVNPSPLDMTRIVQQLEDLVRLAVECEGKKIAPSVNIFEVHKQLLVIRKNLEAFQAAYRRHLASLGLTPEQVKIRPQRTSPIGEKEKEMMERIGRLQEQCEQEREKIHEALLANPEAYRNILREQKTEDHLKKTHRKGKFKSVGGKKNWLPT